MRNTLHFLVCAGILFCTNANATDWRGPYIGAQIGISEFKTDAVITHQDSGFFSDMRRDTHEQSNNPAVLGLLAGYNFQSGPVVFGGQVDLSMSTLDASLDTGPCCMFYGANIQSDWAATFLGRVGVTVGPRVLVYGLGGATYTNFEITNTFAIGFDPGIGVETSDTFRQWSPVYGGGIEIMATDALSFRAEYRRAEYDKSYSESSVIDIGFGPALREKERHDFSFDNHTVLFGVVFNFH